MSPSIMLPQLESLPPELHDRIAGMLNGPDVYRLSHASRCFKHISAAIFTVGTAFRRTDGSFVVSYFSWPNVVLIRAIPDDSMHEPFAEMLRIVHRSGGFVTLHADVLGPASFAAALRLVPGNMRVAVHIKRGDPVPLLSVLAEATWLNQHDLFLDSSELPEMQEIPLLPNTRCLRVSKLVNFGAHLARKMPNLQVLIHRHMDEDTRTFATDQLSNLLSYQRVYRSAIESICLSAPQLRCIRLEMSDHANARLMLATQWRIVTHTLGWKMKRIMGVNITDSHELVVLRLVRMVI